MSTVVTFYRFVAIDDPAELQKQLANLAAEHNIVGTILLAHEGVNATIAHEETVPLKTFIKALTRDPRFRDLECKWSSSKPEQTVFNRLKVRVRREIVNFGGPLDPSNPLGKHVNAKEWNAP